MFWICIFMCGFIDPVIEIEIARALEAQKQLQITQEDPVKKVNSFILKGVQEHRPVVVWLNYKNDKIQNELKDVYHVEVTEWRGNKGPGVIVMRPQDGKYLYWDGVLEASKCTQQEIRNRYFVKENHNPVFIPSVRIIRGSNC